MTAVPEFNGDERRDHRPDYCYQEHTLLARRVGDVESDIKVIKSEFHGLQTEVNRVASMITTIQRNTADTNTAGQKTAVEIESLKNEVRGVKEMMQIIHKYETAGGLVESAKRIGAVMGVLLQVGALVGLVWGLLMFAKRMP